MEYFLKLVTPLAVPAVLLYLGLQGKRIITEHEARLRTHDRIIQKRTEIYENISEDLNSIFVFIIRVGRWKEFRPSEIISKKRDIDQIMHINRPYWSKQTFQQYEHFMSACFEIETGHGEDAKIKAETEKFDSLNKIEDNWRSFFSTKEPELEQVGQHYQELMSAFSDGFGFNQ